MSLWKYNYILHFLKTPFLITLFFVPFHNIGQFCWFAVLSIRRRQRRLGLWCACVFLSGLCVGFPCVCDTLEIRRCFFFFLILFCHYIRFVVHSFVGSSIVAVAVSFFFLRIRFQLISDFFDTRPTKKKIVFKNRNIRRIICENLKKILGSIGSKYIALNTQTKGKNSKKMTSLEPNVNRLQNFKNKGKDQEVSS